MLIDLAIHAGIFVLSIGSFIFSVWFFVTIGKVWDKLNS